MGRAFNYVVWAICAVFLLSCMTGQAGTSFQIKWLEAASIATMTGSGAILVLDVMWVLRPSQWKRLFGEQA